MLTRIDQPTASSPIEEREITATETASPDPQLVIEKARIGGRITCGQERGQVLVAIRPQRRRAG